MEEWWGGGLEGWNPPPPAPPPAPPLAPFWHRPTFSSYIKIKRLADSQNACNCYFFFNRREN